MQTYSTHDLAAQAKVNYWNNVVNGVLMPQETQPKHSECFEAQVQTMPLGRLMMTSVSTSAAKVIRSRQQASQSKERKFNLCLQVKGSLRVTKDDREMIIHEGDMVLADSNVPYTLQYDEPCTTIGLIMDCDDLKRHLPNPEQAVSTIVKSNQGLAHTVAGMLQSLWQQAQEDIEPEIGARVADSFLELYAATWLVRCGVQPADSVAIGYRRTQIKRYIEAQLRDPNLSVCAVAAAFGISARYLHMLFAKEGETVSNYILRRRLDQCVKQLSDPLWHKRTITEIAFSWGFNNATHFARVFRHRYEMTPRDYRNQLLVAA